MSLFKRKPQPKDYQPKDCSLSNVTITSRIERETGQAVHLPIPESDEYLRTVMYLGRFDEYYYYNIGGQFKVKTPVTEHLIFIGAFSCRRIERNGSVATLAKREGQDEAGVVTSMYSAVKDLGICATCPYLGMNEIEADEYDDRANRAEAARLQSEKLLREARQELDQFTVQNGGHIQ